MYAIIETGGKQYRVNLGDVVSVEKIDGDVGQSVTFDKVLLVGGQTDGKVLVGTPFVSKATLTCEIVQQAKGEKLLTIKYKRRKGYRRTIGHRQLLTKLLITKVENGSGQQATLEAPKRIEALKKASVPFSQRQAKHQAEHASKKASPKTTKSTSEKKAAPKTAAKVEKKTSTKTTKKA